MSDVEKMTVKSQEAMQGAAKLAETRGHSAVEPEHVFHELVRQSDGVIPGLITSAGGNLSGFTRDLDTALGRMPEVSGSSRRVVASSRLVKIFVG
ncbi:MAG: Clp protease N-terminal domain-containing protein, partial [Bdellovibrionota bacterium]